MSIPKRVLVPLLVVFLLFVFLESSGAISPVFAQDDCKVPPCNSNDPLVDPHNARLSIWVNASTGRFNIGAFPDPTTGGATAGSWDLIFNWPGIPLTSFTTLRVDGADKVYGSTVDGFQLRPTDIDQLTNRSVWETGDIEVTQTLQIVHNNQTGQDDTARIEYAIHNASSTASHTVGLRVMLDTEINYNDGAPFRVPGVGIVQTEREFLGSAIPDSFSVFYNVTDPDHVAFSTLKSNGATAPDRLVLAGWRRIYYSLYDYITTPGQSFNSDSAYAVYWNPVTLAPGESHTYATLYGLAAITADLRPPLALGIDAPTTLSIEGDHYTPNPFDVVATVYNNGTATATDVELTLELSGAPGLSLAAGTATQSIGNLAVGQERQISWRVQAAAQSTATTLTYAVTAEASNTSPKTVERQITLPALTTNAFTITALNVVGDDGQPLAWDGLVADTLTVQASGAGGNAPYSLTAKVTTLKSNKVTYLSLFKSSVSGDETRYRGSIAASNLVNRPSELTVAAVVYEHEDFDYQVAQKVMDDLGVPQERRMGIAWGNGDEGQDRPPASLNYFRAGGYEPASVELVSYSGVAPDEFFIQNQAKMFLYLGHGSHGANSLFLSDGLDKGTPANVANAWDEGIQTVILFGCSVLDINDVNGWWGSITSPGKEWVNNVPGPETWLGFQAKAPKVGDPPDGQNAEAVLYALASEHAAGKSWVESWRRATGNETSITSYKSVGAVAIEECNYHYWKEYCYPLIGCVRYTWENLSCSDWNSSSQGLQGLMASPAEVHLYDQLGRHMGPNEQGGIDTEIPGSAYWTPIVAGEPDANALRVSINTADLSHSYRLRLVGTGEGTFDFHLEIPDRSTGMLYQITYVHVPVSSGAEFVLMLERGTDFALAADIDGDGVFEGQVAPSGVLTRPLDLPLNLTLSGTVGENGWYVSPVMAAMIASTRPDLPPMVSQEYDLGDGWQPYVAPLDITQEGIRALRYRGTFADGSLDVAQWVNIGVDTTLPVVSITQPSSTTYTLGSSFTVEYEAYDAISGLEAVTATFDGQTAANGQTFDTLFLTPGPHEVVVIAQDRAGWITTATRTIEVEATIPSLISAKHRLYDMGWIYGPGAQGIVRSLDAKLDAAQRAHEHGQHDTAVNILNAFVREVEAQTGKHITAEAADILIRGAQYIANGDDEG